MPEDTLMKLDCQTLRLFNCINLQIITFQTCI